MSEQIVPVFQIPGGELARVDDSVAADVLKRGDFLPYINVMGSNSNFVKESKIAMGTIAIISNQTPVDLGKEVVVVVIGERAKAMRFESTPMSYYDPKTEEFKKIQAESAVKDSSCAAGLEFLIWLPNVGEKGTFATLFCGGVSLKREAVTIRKYVGGKPALLKVHLASTPKYKWHTLVSAPYNSPITVQPDEVTFKKVLNDFTNPISSKVEKADAPASGRAR